MLSSTTTTVTGLLRRRREKRRSSARRTRREFLKATGLLALSAAGETWAASAEELGRPSSAASHDDSQARPALFSPQAKWIWDDSDRWSYHHYVQARRTFTVGEPDLAMVRGGAPTLAITADAYYQAWLNGRVIGEGPAKSAEGRRSVDLWPIASLLLAGKNELLIVALSLGTGTMTYCPDEAGLIFELDLGRRRVPSDDETEVRPDPARQKRTARRWILPCIEDIDDAAEGGEWKSAKVVGKQIQIYPRRVPLPTREVLSVKRMVMAEVVRPPNVAISMRLRPYLTDGDQKRRSNPFAAPAYIVTDIVSPIDQKLTFTPTLGNVTWYFRGQKIFEGSGWRPWVQTDPPAGIDLRKGPNRLVGLHDRTNHFEDINLAGFAAQPVEFTNPFGRGAFQVVRVREARALVEGPTMEKIDWNALRPAMGEMDPLDSMPFGNPYDLVYGARQVGRDQPALKNASAGSSSEPLVIPPAPPGLATRVIVDLGVLHNGWLAFDAEGRKGSLLVLAMFEGLEPGPPIRIQWPGGCNNALAYRLRDGRQSFESFFAYGVRYIAIQHTGDHHVRLGNLRVFTANCGSALQGSLLVDDELLNSIYRICAQSVISGVNDTFTDCPTFEQVNWNFDNRAAAMADAATCANYAVTRNSIELFDEDPRFRGLVRSQYPSTWESQIPMWAFHWIMWCRDYYWQTADMGFAQRIMPRVAAGIREGLDKIGPRGLLEWPGTWHFIEWGNGRDDDHDVMSAEQAGFVGALDAAIELAAVTGNQYGETAEKWRSARANLVRAVNDNLWDAKRQAYFDSLHRDGSPSPVTSQTTNAAMAVYGFASAERAKELARRILAGDPQLLPYGSPYGLYYVLELLDQQGDTENIFSIIRRRWGEMVLAGDTCTWETFAEFGYLDWPTRSRCHPFAAYVAKYMTRYLLGVNVLAPGYAKFHIELKLPEGINHCHGSVPTPKGLIRVGWERRAEKIQLNVEHPTGLERV